MKKIILLSLLFITLFANQKVVLQLDWLNQFQFAGYYMAKELGYYKDVGLDVEIKELTCKTDLLSVIPKKEADFAIGHSSLLISKIHGADIVALGAIYQTSPMVLLTRDDTNINSLEDLKNKRVMLTGDAKDMASVMAMFFSKGLSQKDIIVVPHSFNLDDLINKKTDAMASYISNEPIHMRDKGVGYKIFNPKDYGFHFYGDILFTSSEYIKNNPKVTRDFYEATLKGWAYAFDNISQSAEVIHKNYNTQNKSLIQLIKEGEILKHLAYKQDTPLGYLDKDQLNDIVKVYKLLGMVTKDLDCNSFIYENNHPTELAFKLHYKEIFYISIIALLLITSLILILFFVSFKKRWIHTKSHLKEIISQQNEEIEKQNRIIMLQAKIAAVGEILSNIAHQWRQPLNIISLNIVKMETSLLLGHDIKKDEILNISGEINLQTQYLSQTIDDFKNYFNSDMDSSTLFHVKDAISKVSELTKDVFTTHQITTVTTIQDCMLTCNENLLIQALLNIYNNAKDAIDESQTKEKYFFIDLTCKGKECIIAIKDSGMGIKEDILDKIFEPYFTTKHKSKGTGLGLYIAYTIVTEHLKGTIEVKNVEYDYQTLHLHGVEFVIRVPLP